MAPGTGTGDHVTKGLWPDEELQRRFRWRWRIPASASESRAPWNSTEVASAVAVCFKRFFFMHRAIFLLTVHLTSPLPGRFFYPEKHKSKIRFVSTLLVIFATSSNTRNMTYPLSTTLYAVQYKVEIPKFMYEKKTISLIIYMIIGI